MRYLGPAVLVVLGVSGLAACGTDDSAAPAPTTEPTSVVSSSPDAARAGDCAEVIADDAVRALGWPVSDPVEETVRGCERRAGDNSVFVSTDARVVAGEGRGDRAQKYFDQACRELAKGPGPAVDPEPDVIGPAQRACLRGLPVGADAGEVGLVVRTQDDSVVQIRLFVATPTSTGQLAEGLALLVEGVDSAY